MQALMRGRSHMDKSCLYLALDALLGDKWSIEGRKFCLDIIEEHEGYPSNWNYIIPEFAPVKLWQYFNFRYTQPDIYVELYRGGWVYRVPRATQVVVSYTYRANPNQAHAACMPLNVIADIDFDVIFAMFIPNDLVMIKTKL
jgi:hypothetical protein